MRIQKRYGPLNIYAGTAPPAKNKAQGYKKSKKKKKKKRTTPAASFIKAYPNATLHEKANNLIQNFQNMDAPSRHKFYKNSLSQPADWQVTPKKYKPKVGANKSSEILDSQELYAKLLHMRDQIEFAIKRDEQELKKLEQKRPRNQEEMDFLNQKIQDLQGNYDKLFDRYEKIEDDINNWDPTFNPHDLSFGDISDLF
mmetsp:Transcript_17397/g.22922  ORF Transcript_17397/g.22922 Transcript_17397/m.22922 type:complete len:198 (-) Transcript_17397:40-633(-)